MKKVFNLTLLCCFLIQFQSLAQGSYLKTVIILNDGSKIEGKSKPMSTSQYDLDFRPFDKVKLKTNDSTTKTILSNDINLLTYYWNGEPAITLKHVVYRKGKKKNGLLNFGGWLYVLDVCEDAELYEGFEGLRHTKNGLRKMYEGSFYTTIHMRRGKEELPSLIGSGSVSDRDESNPSKIYGKLNLKQFKAYFENDPKISNMAKDYKDITYNFLEKVFRRVCEDND